MHNLVAHFCRGPKLTATDKSQHVSKYDMTFLKGGILEKQHTLVVFPCPRQGGTGEAESGAD